MIHGQRFVRERKFTANIVNQITPCLLKARRQQHFQDVGIGAGLEKEQVGRYVQQFGSNGKLYQLVQFHRLLVALNAESDRVGAGYFAIVRNAKA